jgi:hypothetical protein
VNWGFAPGLLVMACLGAHLMGAAPRAAGWRLRSGRRVAVPPENRIMALTWVFLGFQAARSYSLIGPLRTGFRRICRIVGADNFIHVMRPGDIR